MTAPTDIHWAAMLTAAGSLLGGLALPIAFVQLGALRRDRLRAQVNKVGAWVDDPPKRFDPAKAPATWTVTVHIRNSSELPVVVQRLEVLIESQWDDPKHPQRWQKWRTHRSSDPYEPLTIAPERLWTGSFRYTPEDRGNRLLVVGPRVSLAEVRLTDAAGLVWEIRPSSPGPPKRIVKRRLVSLWWWLLSWTVVIFPPRKRARPQAVRPRVSPEAPLGPLWIRWSSQSQE